MPQLYSKIKQNGYEILYLSARAIGQSGQTRNFLNRVQQNRAVMPQGPLMISPEGVLPSFKREVIYKKPHILKIKILKDIRRLFPKVSPFYAGFGNKQSDYLAYQGVKI